MRAIAIDDEPIALDVLRAHIGNIPFVDLVSTFTSPAKALAFLTSEQIDVVFLDINMPDINGFDLAALFPNNSQVIFTTAYQEHALKAFDIAAADYLLKPISYGRLLQACSIANQRLDKVTNAKMQSPVIFVKDGYSLVKIDMDKITYIEAGDNYLSIYEDDKRTLSRITIAEITKKLPDDSFLRVHKSYVVSLKKIERLEGNQLLIKGTKIPVSQTYRDQLIEKLNSL